MAVVEISHGGHGDQPWVRMHGRGGDEGVWFDLGVSVNRATAQVCGLQELWIEGKGGRMSGERVPMHA